MRPGAIKVETKGSFFWIDEAACEYLRLPKEERPRERAEWSDERAGALQDGVWHPMAGWRIGPHPEVERLAGVAADILGWPIRKDIFPADGLMIDTPNGKTTWAPDAVVVG